MTRLDKKVMSEIIIILITFWVFPYICLSVQAQPEIDTPFTSADKFSTPEFNSSISFSSNGTFSTAKLLNDTWTFTNLRLNVSSPSVGNLTVSIHNSNMTITSFRYYQNSQSATLRYNVEGVGTQKVNLGLDSSQTTHASEWGVTLPGSIFLAEGENWKLLPDNTVIIMGLTGSISVSHYGFSVESGRNTPFYLQHSIIITTIILLLIVIAITLAIKLKGKS